MTDITMNLNDTLELDTIIEEWKDSNKVLDLNGDESSFNISGIQTKTSILDPQETGNYTITINGQDLSVEVTDTSTIPDILDDFEASRYDDQNKTLADYYGGDTGDFTRQQSVVYEGSYALEYGGGNTQSFISNTAYTLKVGDVVQSRIRTDDDGAEPGILLFTDEETATPNGYGINLRANGDDIQLSRYDDGSQTTLKSGGSGISESTWYVCQIYKDTSDVVHAIVTSNDNNNSIELTHTDTAYTSGGYGFQGYRDNIYADSVKYNP